MNRTHRLVASVAVGAFLLVGASACGSSGGSDSSSDDAAKTTVAADGGGSTDDTTADTADSGSDEGDAGSEQDCDATAESNNLSGDSVVLFAADQDELMESDLTDDDVAVIAADGSSMDPADIEVEAGTMFGFKSEGGGSIDAVIVGCAGGQTLVPNVAVGFVISEPGTYPVSLDVAGTELGTVTVS